MSNRNAFPTPVIKGYDVVAYFDGEPTPGDSALNAQHQGQTYYFSSAENKARFEASPEKFVPAYGGWCATAMSDGKLFGADPTSFKITNGRLFLFYRGIGGNTRPDWDADEARRTKQADENWQRGAAA